jgi:hypothetical protein
MAGDMSPLDAKLTYERPAVGGLLLDTQLAGGRAAAGVPSTMIGNQVEGLDCRLAEKVRNAGAMSAPWTKITGSPAPISSYSSMMPLSKVATCTVHLLWRRCDLLEGVHRRK